MPHVPLHKTTMAFLQASSLLVAAYPVHDSAHIARSEAQPVSLDEAPGRRTIIVVFCIGYVFLLALAQGMIFLSVPFRSLYRLGLLTYRRLSCRSHGWSKNQCKILRYLSICARLRQYCFRVRCWYQLCRTWTPDG